MNTPNLTQLKRIADIYLSDIEFNEFKRLYRKNAEEQYSFLLINTTLPSDYPSRFQKDLLEEV